jgi:hypothetical protein
MRELNSILEADVSTGEVLEGLDADFIPPVVSKKRIVRAFLISACALIVVFFIVGLWAARAQSVPGMPAEMQPSSLRVNVNGLAQFLKDLQPKSDREPGGRLEVVAAYLHPALVGSFDAMAHGWCEGAAFLGCAASHFPIPVTVLTGSDSREYFRVPATEQWLALPGGLSRHAAPVHLLKKIPSSAVWLAWGRTPLEQYVITGPLLNGTGESATILKAPGLATTMHRQMFLSELIAQSPRWKP